MKKGLILTFATLSIGMSTNAFASDIQVDALDAQSLMESMDDLLALDGQAELLRRDGDSGGPRHDSNAGRNRGGRDHDRGGDGNGRVTCYARNGAGVVFRARGFGDEYSKLRRAMYQCRKHSVRPNSCRPMGCRD